MSVSEESSDDEPPPPPPPPRTEAPQQQQKPQLTTATPSTAAMLQRQPNQQLQPPNNIMPTLYPPPQHMTQSGLVRPGLPQGTALSQGVVHGIAPAGVVHGMPPAHIPGSSVQSSSDPVLPTGVPPVLLPQVGLPAGTKPTSLQGPIVNASGVTMSLPSKTLAQMPSPGVTNPVSLQTPVGGPTPPVPLPPILPPPLPQGNNIPPPPLPSQPIGGTGPSHVPSVGSILLPPPNHTALQGTSPSGPGLTPVTSQHEQYLNRTSGQNKHLPNTPGERFINHSIYPTSSQRQTPSKGQQPLSNGPSMNSTVSSHATTNHKSHVSPSGGPTSFSQQSPRVRQYAADTGMSVGKQTVASKFK